MLSFPFMKPTEKVPSQFDLAYFVGHSPQCSDPLRNSCYERINMLLAESCSQIQHNQIFLENESALNSLIATLPTEADNLLTNVELREKKHILTQKTVTDMWHFWKESMSSRQNFIHLFGNLDRQLRRFSLTLNYLFAIEAFLLSPYSYLLTFEDDSWLDDNFLYTVRRITNLLPAGWDIFNFVVPEDEKFRYRESFRVHEEISEIYQTWSAASLLWSRKGARKVLKRLALDFHSFKFGDPNGDQQIDSLISNMILTPPFDSFQLTYYVERGDRRPFQTYTFVPDFQSPVSQSLEVKSTLEG